MEAPQPEGGKFRTGNGGRGRASTRAVEAHRPHIGGLNYVQRDTAKGPQSLRGGSNRRGKANRTEERITRNRAGVEVRDCARKKEGSRTSLSLVTLRLMIGDGRVEPSRPLLKVGTGRGKEGRWIRGSPRDVYGSSAHRISTPRG